VEESLVDLRGMTLTVLDGVIPGKLLAEENLRFEAWTMYWAGQKKRTDSIRPVAGGMVFWR
jgi:hypothetical protein